jgi:hypothetical protein
MSLRYSISLQRDTSILVRGIRSHGESPSGGEFIFYDRIPFAIESMRTVAGRRAVHQTSMTNWPGSNSLGEPFP